VMAMAGSRCSERVLLPLQGERAGRESVSRGEDVVVC
jgi:hypothetical protein